MVNIVIDMFRMVFFLGLIIVVSCGENGKGDKIQKVTESTKVVLPEIDSTVYGEKTKIDKDSLFLPCDIDSVEILCLFFGEYGEKSFRIFLTNKEYSISRTSDERNVISRGVNNIKDSLISNITQFYINKEDKIILNKTKRDYIRSMDYPYIKVIGYRNKKEIFNEAMKIGDEEYDIEYNPKFLEFYEFLDLLVK